MTLDYDMDKDDDFSSPASIFDGEERDEEELWFVPHYDDEDVEPLGTRAIQGDLPESLQVKMWEDAERTHTSLLADVMYEYGRMTSLVVEESDLSRSNLYLREALDLMWMAGEPLSAKDYLRYLSGGSVASTKHHAFYHTQWLHRKILTPLSPHSDDVLAYLERGLSGENEEISEKVQVWRGMLSSISHLHPLTQSCYALSFWRSLSDEGGRGLIEGYLLSGKISERHGVFIPVAMGGRGLTVPGHTVESKLLRYLESVLNGSLRILLQLRERKIWMDKVKSSTLTVRAKDEVADLCGSLPFFTASLLRSNLNLSKKTSERVLTEMEDLGLSKEVTGQKRFKVWVPKY